MSKRGIFEVAIMARVTWDLHSLNNEGTVGNVTEPRTVVLANGQKTDGVSGEMLKHIHTYNIWLLRKDDIALCPACQRLQPQKADLPEYRDSNEFKGVDNLEAMKRAINNCTLCDLHGFLMQRPAIARRSTVEFGWAIGIPEVHRDIHIHARHSMEERGAPRGQAQEEEREVAAQMVYHRPTRSGAYAVISVFQPWRIGLNEIDYGYAIEAGERTRRYHLALKGYKAMFMRAEGAMTSTRLPHVEGIEGSVAISETNFPAPLISPLKDGYRSEVETLVHQNGGITLHSFSSIAEFCSIMDDLAEEEPFAMGG